MSHPEYENIGDPAIRFVEECAELIKAVSKGERFGWSGHHPERQQTNLDELRAEWADAEKSYTRLIGHIMGQTPTGKMNFSDWIADVKRRLLVDIGLDSEPKNFVDEEAFKREFYDAGISPKDVADIEAGIIRREDAPSAGRSR